MSNLPLLSHAIIIDFQMDQGNVDVRNVPMVTTDLCQSAKPVTTLSQPPCPISRRGKPEKKQGQKTWKKHVNGNTTFETQLLPNQVPTVPATSHCAGEVTNLHTSPTINRVTVYSCSITSTESSSWTPENA